MKDTNDATHARTETYNHAQPHKLEQAASHTVAAGKVSTGPPLPRGSLESVLDTKQ